MMQNKVAEVPAELDLPAHYGFTMRGWDFNTTTVRDAIRAHRMLNPAMELGSNVCPWNCDFCFTEPPENPDGRKRRLPGEMSLERRLRLIDEAADLGAASINFVGAGEPTIDPGFWELIDRMSARRITPVIYSEGTLKLTHEAFCRRLFDAGATVVLKVNSLSNRDFQNRVLRGIRPKVGVPTVSYFDERRRALELLMDTGFNDCVPTRLAFDTIICRENIDEIESIHRFARMNNIFALLVNFLPSGRTKDGHTTAIPWSQQHEVFRRLAQIDREELGIDHRDHFPYAGGVPCTIRGLGLFVKIRGDVFDCPGESSQLGNVLEQPLSDLWKKARPITESFDGGCYPREQAWRKLTVLSLPSH